jgi:uncharacterized integral membrane protein
VQIFAILAILIAVIAVIFALQNITTVTVSLFIWSFQSSLALALLIALGVGVIISMLISLPGLIGTRFSLSRLKKKVTTLETERDDFKQKADKAGKEISELELQLANLSADLEKALNKPSNPPVEKI